MKLIIDIPDGDYEFIKDLQFVGGFRGGFKTIQHHVINAIKNSKPYKPDEERSQVKCEKCDFRKFTETFVDGVVDVMNKNGITSVEQLQEMLKGDAKNDQ